MALGRPAARHPRRCSCGKARLLGLAAGVFGVSLGAWRSANSSRRSASRCHRRPGMSRGYVAEIAISPALALDGFLLAFITTLLAGIPSAWKASRMNIVDALRHQTWRPCSTSSPCAMSFRQRVRSMITLAAIVLGVTGLILSGGFRAGHLRAARRGDHPVRDRSMSRCFARAFAKGSRQPDRYLDRRSCAAGCTHREHAAGPRRLQPPELSGLLNNGKARPRHHRRGDRTGEGGQAGAAS